ncbi:MAG: S9 family peptidase [Candidatus Solibacter usitatus]|nr:S9 family peptidase [Candidatus Solibacter usitatus]
MKTIALAIATCVTLLAQTARHPLTAQDLLAGKAIGEAQISPDGATVAFTISENDPKTNQSTVQLVTVPSRGGSVTPMAQAPEGATSLRWSPDGTRLAFIAAKEGKSAIWILDFPSGEVKRICDYDRSNAFLAKAGNMLAWSPDGTRLAFAGTLDPAQPRPDPLVVTRILYKTRTSIWDGRRSHIYVVPSSGGEPRAVTSGKFDEHSIDWGGDGKQIVFLSNHQPDPDALLNYDIFAVNVESRATRQLTTTPGVEMDPKVSPDGRWIAYTSTTRNITTIDSVAEDAHVWVVPADGGKGRELNAALDRRSSSAFWTPDSKFVIFTVGDHGKVAIYRTPLEGGASTPVVNQNAQAGAVSIGKEGTMVFTMTTPSMPAELFVLAVGGPARITSLNEELVKQWQLATPEEINIRSFDGTPIQGWLYPALNAKGRSPMILSIHGGPHGAFGYGFNPTAQFYAARGYATLTVNPRGSSGYGQRFSDGCVNNWGGGDYRDLMLAVDYVVKTHAKLDGNRLGVTGGSYGGFMTNWVITQTTRFKAAVAVASLSNLISFYATSMYQDLVHAEFNGYPWDNFETVWKWSPLAHVKKVTTPTLFIHGEQDNDVHITQAEEMYTALRQRGVEAELVRYPREGHGLREPLHRVDAAKRTVSWMDKHLK